LFVNGTLQTVVIDDYLPVDPELDVVCFGRSREWGELWVSLIEKAWAKLHKCYSRITAGMPSTFYQAMTNRPSMLYDHTVSSKEDVWQAMEHCH
jgi:hypothetical protein